MKEIKDSFTHSQKGIGNLEMIADPNTPDFYYELYYNSDGSIEKESEITLAFIRNISESMRSLQVHMRKGKPGADKN